MKKIFLLVVFLTILFSGCSRKKNLDFTFFKCWDELQANPTQQKCWEMEQAIKEYNLIDMLSYVDLRDQSYSLLQSISTDCTYLHILLNNSLTKEDAELLRVLNRIDRHMVYLAQAKMLALQRTNDTFFKYFAILTLTTIILCAFFVVLNNRELKERDSRLSKSTDVISYIVKAQENERRKISRELHDSVAQELRMISLLSSKIQDKALADEILDIQKKCITEIRSMCQNLIPPDLSSTNLADSIRLLCQKFLEKSNAELRLTISDNVDFSCFDNDQQINIFRIVQESLNNILKHAQAKEVTVLLTTDSFVNSDGESVRYLKIIISDDGKGIGKLQLSQMNNNTSSFAAKNHFGVRNIKERINLLGGSVHFKSIEGMGTEVFIRLPLKENPMAAQVEAK